VIGWRHRGLTAADAFVTSYPKSGNTWLKAMLTYLACGREFDFDHHTELSPSVGFHRGVAGILPGGGRLIKSHEPYLSPVGDRYPRLVYLVRDGRDVAVSYFHHSRRKGSQYEDLEAFFKAFLDGSVDGYGCWHEHVRSWLESPQASDGRLIVVRYEDLQDDPVGELARAARFLSLSTAPAALREAVARHTADRMREQERSSAFHASQPRKDVLFVRRATRGEWSEALTEEQVRRFEAIAGPTAARLGYPVGIRPRAVA
jgi:hypothetical protein